MYVKKDGIFTPFFSAIAFIIKLGPLPMYVKPPKNTDVRHIVLRNSIELGYKPCEKANTS